VSGAAAVLTDWLLDSDPALRWQVLQDLLGAPREQVTAERRRVPDVGWGAELLALQDPDGRWAGALYSPKWTSTTYTLLLLDRLGLPADRPEAQAACRVLWREARRYDGGLTLARTVQEPETCITAMLVLLACRFGHVGDEVDATVRWLVDQRGPDGGWNCERVRTGSRHGSFHTSISVLEALHAYATAGGSVSVTSAIADGCGFFLDHQLYRSHRTGEVVDAAMMRFPFPPQWHFDIVRGLELFRAVDASRDPRLASAVEAVRGSRSGDGTWRRWRPYPGRTWFTLEPPGPSRWSTFRALRVLRWWDGGAS
jgi:hypothetical protein